MSGRILEVRGRAIGIEEAGEGEPLPWLHGIADVNGVMAGLSPFHMALAEGARLIAPAHPGCAASDEDGTLESIDDLAFHTLEVMDALGLDTVHLAGACIGGWLAAEIATRNPERVLSLTLVAPSGLFVSGAPIGDLFMAVQPENGSLDALRSMMFADAGSRLAKELFPDEGADGDASLRLYKAFRFAARVGFHPPYFHNRKLVDRLYRFRRPAVVVGGAQDRMVPRSHFEAYAAGLPGASLRLLDGCGHSPHLEAPEEAAQAVAAVRAAAM
jgi:pimeloyl-ACP methyl ester carboxylesterase